MRAALHRCDPSLPLDSRVADLLSRLTVAEKAAAINSNGVAIPRVCVPYQTNTPAPALVSPVYKMPHLSRSAFPLTSFHRGLQVGLPKLGAAEDTHGVVCGCGKAAGNGTGCPTQFPAGPGLGASFDRTLWADIGLIIATEARALNNQQRCPLYFLDPVRELQPRCPTAWEKAVAHTKPSLFTAPSTEYQSDAGPKMGAGAGACYLLFLSRA